MLSPAERRKPLEAGESLMFYLSETGECCQLIAKTTHRCPKMPALQVAPLHRLTPCNGHRLMEVLLILPVVVASETILDAVSRAE